MASNGFDSVLRDLLGEELYREFCVSDHTHTRSDGLGVSAHASFEGGGADCNLDLESILLEASNQFEYSGLPSTNEENISAGQLQRFATPKSDEEVERARKARIPKKTQADTRYCVEIWNTIQPETYYLFSDFAL